MVLTFALVGAIIYNHEIATEANVQTDKLSANAIRTCYSQAAAWRVLRPQAVAFANQAGVDPELRDEVALWIGKTDAKTPKAETCRKLAERLEK